MFFILLLLKSTKVKLEDIKLKLKNITNFFFKHSLYFKLMYILLSTVYIKIIFKNLQIYTTAKTNNS